MIDHIKVTQQKKLEHCNKFLLNVKSLGFGINRHFCFVSKIQAKQQKYQTKSDFTKSSRYLPIAPCF